MNKYNGVLIGCGGRAAFHADSYRAVKGLELVAVADTIEERAKQFATKYGTRYYLEAEEMLDKEDPDIVTIATREKPRAELTKMAAKHGVKGIVAEKSMACNVAEARSMVKACEESGTLLTVCHQMRFCDEFISARDVLRRGGIGRPYFMRAACYGSLIGQGTHMIDMLLYLNNDTDVDWVVGGVADLKAAPGAASRDEPDFVSAYVTFENDVRAMVECGPKSQVPLNVVPLGDESFELWLRKRVQILGFDGTIEAQVSHHCRMMNTSQQGWQMLVSGGGNEGWLRATPRLYEELVKVLSEGGEHRNNARVSLRGFEVLQAILQSALTRERVRPPIPEDADPLPKLMTAIGE